MSNRPGRIEEQRMIDHTSEPCEGACVVHLDGTFEPTDDPLALVDLLAAEAQHKPLVIDLSGVRPAICPEVTVLVQALAHAPTHGATVLVHPDLETRRVLRAAADGLPVVPSNDLVLHGRFAAALAVADDVPSA
jgi:hypothetical protein